MAQFAPRHVLHSKGVGLIASAAHRRPPTATDGLRWPPMSTRNGRHAHRCLSTLMMMMMMIIWPNIIIQKSAWLNATAHREDKLRVGVPAVVQSRLGINLVDVSRVLVGAEGAKGAGRRLSLCVSFSADHWQFNGAKLVCARGRTYCGPSKWPVSLAAPPRLGSIWGRVASPGAPHSSRE